MTWQWLNSSWPHGSAHQWRWDGPNRQAVSGCGEVLSYARLGELVNVPEGDEPRHQCRACLKAEAKRERTTA